MRGSLRVLALAAAAALTLAACGGGEEEVTESPSPRGVTIEIEGSTFKPDEVTIAAGTTVVWKHIDVLPHTVTADDESFDSSPDCASVADGAKCLNRGDTFTRTFDAPGRVPYYCKIHGGRGGVGQAGVIVVQ